MGIVEEDIARVRAATDFVALASEHIALKRIGRQYQGLCPFHSEKTPSFSINPEKGVYYCYGCQASGDTISFVMELEKLDFAQAVERLAAKANITLRYDSEAAGRDRARRTALTDAMERAVDWYHDRLLKGADAGAARAYLRSRGYDGDAIRRFRIGWAPEGWDTLCKALKLPTDVAKDTGLGYVNKVGKINDFFQKRILFPIYDASGNPVAFGGRKLPDTEGPKYKNSSETRLYSKSKILYGLNWAKNDIVATGEVIVCEGYTDVIAFHRNGLPRAVATCGTALADEHFKTLKNYARRLVLAYDADSAGQNAAAKFYGWERQYEIDLFVLSLPPGSDPAELAAKDPEALRAAVQNAKPFLAFRVDREIAAANLGSPEGRARAYERASAVVSEHPNALVREQYLVQIAARCQVSEESMTRTLQAATDARVDPPSERVMDQRRGGSAPDDRGPQRREPAPSQHPQDSARAVRGGRATSPGVVARLASERAHRAEEEVLRWLVQDTERVMAWVDPALFALGRHRRAVELLRAFGEVNAASDAVEAMADQRIDDEAADQAHQQFVARDREVVRLLRRFAVAEPEADDFVDALAIVVANTCARIVASITANTDSDTEALHSVASIKLLALDLHEPATRVDALTQLVPWLASWDAQRRQGRDSAIETGIS